MNNLLKIKEELNECGQVLYREEKGGFWVKNEYDDLGRIIHHWDSTGYEYWRTYKEDGGYDFHLVYPAGISKKDINGFEEWSSYDVSGNLIKQKRVNG